MNAMTAKSVLVSLAGFLLLLSAGPCWAAEKGVSEYYRFESVPMGGENAEGEVVEVTVTSGDQAIQAITRTIRPSAVEEVAVETDLTGWLRSASRRFSPAGGGGEKRGKIWRDDGKAYLQEGGDQATLRSYNLPPGKILAVDGSLLLLIRAFPFGRIASMPLFMIDFSGLSITVTLALAGIETVTVPAGVFECYRMEATVEIPLLRPRIIYWVAREKPHFLVKSIGKQGPFTPSYITSLLSRE